MGVTPIDSEELSSEKGTSTYSHPVRAACLVVYTLVEEESQLILLLESLAVRACVRALCARTLLNTTQFRM